MFAQKSISKLLNITKTSRFFLIVFMGILGFSVSFYQYAEISKNKETYLLDSKSKVALPFPD
jgi:hypothetical protein